MRIPKLHANKKHFLFFILLGFTSLIWFLLRVVPKPSRINYPCQRYAAGYMTSFLLWLFGSVFSITVFKKGLKQIKNNYLLSGLAITFFAIVLAGISFVLMPAEYSLAIERTLTGAGGFTPEPANQPIGVANGINPGSVAWYYDPEVTTYNPSVSNGNWWENRNTNPVKVDKMFTESLDAISGATRTDYAWSNLIHYRNIQRGKGDVGYSPGEKVAIKANLLIGLSGGKERASGPGPTPQLLLTIVDDLINEVGVPGQDITVYDVSARIPDYIMAPFKNHTNAEFRNVHFVGNPGYITENRYLPAKEDLNAKIHFADTTVTDIYWVKTVTESDYIINLTNLKAHNMAGVTFCAKNLYGSVYIPTATSLYTFGFGPNNQYYKNGKKDPHSGLHKNATVHDFEDGNVGFLPAREMGTHNYLVDLLGHPEVYNKTILYVVDAIYGGKIQNQITKFMSFGNKYSASLFISQDPIALESVCLDFLRNEPQCDQYVHGNVDNYLHESALANNPPSGVKYDPAKTGTALKSLGVHEHWNNKTDKQYTRNLKTGNGIELLKMHEPTTGIDAPANHDFTFKNYPNPFLNSTTIEYNLGSPQQISLTVFDINGKIIGKLVNQQNQAQGTYRLDFHAASLPRGTYICKISGLGKWEKTIKMIKN